VRDWITTRTNELSILTRLGAKPLNYDLDRALVLGGASIQMSLSCSPVAIRPFWYQCAKRTGAGAPPAAWSGRHPHYDRMRDQLGNVVRRRGNEATKATFCGLQIGCNRGMWGPKGAHVYVYVGRGGLCEHWQDKLK
jgi:hypothetical protein